MKRIKHIGSPIAIDYDRQTITYQFDFVDTVAPCVNMVVARW